MLSPWFSRRSRRLMALLLAFVLVAAACGGGGDGGTDAAGGDDTADGGAASGGDAGGGDAADGGDDASGADTDPSDEADGGGAVGEGGGQTDAGLVETLGLPECPVGAHLDADGPIEIDFWHPYVAETEAAMQDLAAGFNASQDKIVVNVQAQGSYSELLAKYRESISFDDLPGIAVVDGQAFRDMVDSGTVLPAQSCVEADGFDLSGIDDTVRGFYSLDGALYPSALTVSTPVLYYNRASFEAAGLDPDSPPGTLAELRDAAQAIKDAGVATEPLSLILQGWFVDTWLTGAGVPIVNADNGRAGNATEANLLSPEAIEIYTILQEMDQAGLIAAFSNTPGQFEHYFAALDETKVAMLLETSTAATTIAGFLGGTANLNDLVESAGVDSEIVGNSDLNLDLDVGPFPGLREPGRVFVSGGAFYMTLSGTDAEQAAAWEFMKYVNQAEQQKIVHLKGSYLPVSSEVANDPQVQQVWANDIAGSWLQTSYEQLQAIDPTFPGPAVGPFSEQRDIMNRSLDELILGDGDPQTVLQDAQNELDDALQAYNDANF